MDGGTGRGYHRGNRRTGRYDREEEDDESEEVFMDKEGRVNRRVVDRRNRGNSGEDQRLETEERDGRGEEDRRRGGREEDIGSEVAQHRGRS